ncbi:MAG: hypothetical protein EOL97_12435 [Spirochaetia bacterium]|nr:hypothetical protein [Spirochaetia bacterium]
MEKYIFKKVIINLKNKNSLEKFFNFLKIKNTKKEGSALLMAIVLLASMLLVVFVFFEIINNDLKSSKVNQDSIKSYYAAEAGIEDFLYGLVVGGQALPNTLGEMDSGSLSNGPTYSVRATNLSPIVIQSVGSYEGMNRSIQLDFKD